ncbi:MAG: ASKHA domain-containing protein, partial [bacterium]
AVYIGLFPDIPRNLFIFMGNSSITGGRMCLLSGEAKDMAGEINKKMTYIDLSSNPVFMQEYTASLFFPHTNLELFPSYRKEYEK